MKPFYYLLFLLLIAGCVTNSGSDSDEVVSHGYGLIITNFTSDFNSLRIYESTNLRLSFINNGDFIARNVSSILYGEGLLERVHEINFTNSLGSNLYGFHLWTLKAPLKLSQSDVSYYTVSDRIYYDYNFSTTQQVGLVPLSYSGGDLSLSSVVKRSPLIASVSFRNPLRTIPEGEGSDTNVFSLTVSVVNKGDGSVGYFNCSFSNGCSKNGYLNSFFITVPADWELITDYDWIISEGDGLRTYLLDYSALNDSYFSNNCDEIHSGANCPRIVDSLQALRLVRDTETNIILRFRSSVVSDVTVNQVITGGDFGYIIDARNFVSPITIRVSGD